MAVTQSQLVYAKRVKGKGRGVFARERIPAGAVIETVPVLVFPTGELPENSRLGDYCFTWGTKTVAIALGYGSLYNHSFTPNALYEDHFGQLKTFRAIRDIQPGEEITVNYNGEPDDRSDVGFEAS